MQTRLFCAALDPLVGDYLLRYAIQREFHADDDAGEFAGWYARLADACAAALPLGEVLAEEARAVENADLARAEAANPRGEWFFWTRSVSSVEELHEFARMIEALIAIDEVTREEAEQLFRHRAERIRTTAVRVRGDGDAAQHHLESVWSSLPWVSQRDVPDALARVGLLDGNERDSWQRRMRPGPWESGAAEIGDVGEAVERWVGPSERRCGVRVLAVERCSKGSIVHLHLARAARDERGDWRAMEDEVVGADAAAWPGFPKLWLEDDLGTDYRGEIAADASADARNSSIDGEHDGRFAPAIPGGASGLWLVSDDPRVRFKLR